MGAVDKNKKKSKAFGLKPKLTIQFDEEARREYLTGFQKRKKERREKALKEAEEKVKKARQERRTEIRERVKQLRELNEIDVPGTGDLNEANADANENEQAEVQQYSDDEHEITVVTTTEITPFSLEGDNPGEDKEGSDNDDPLAQESEKRQKVQDAMLELKMLKKKPLPSMPQPKAKHGKRGRGMGGHGEKRGAQSGKRAKHHGKGSSRGDSEEVGGKKSHKKKGKGRGR